MSETLRMESAVDDLITLIKESTRSTVTIPSVMKRLRDKGHRDVEIRGAICLVVDGGIAVRESNKLRKPIYYHVHEDRVIRKGSVEITIRRYGKKFAINPNDDGPWEDVQYDCDGWFVRARSMPLSRNINLSRISRRLGGEGLIRSYHQRTYDNKYVMSFASSGKFTIDGKHPKHLFETKEQKIPA